MNSERINRYGEQAAVRTADTADRAASRAELARKIQEISFYLDDITLYLDIHPYDETALAAKERHQELERRLEAEYQRRFGPIRMTEADVCRRWSWVECPWPWEYDEESED